MTSIVITIIYLESYLLWQQRCSCLYSCIQPTVPTKL